MAADRPQPAEKPPLPAAHPSAPAPHGVSALDGSGDRLAGRLRGFGPLWLLSFVLIVLGGVVPGGSALLVLLWRSLSRTPWSELGFARPGSWPRTIVLGVVIGAAFKLLMKSVVMPLLGADPVNQAYHDLAGNRAAIPGFLFALLVGAGFGEETLFRGYLFERLRRLMGRSVGASVATVAITSALFAAAHLPNQGVPGAEQAAVTGLAFGAIYAVTGGLPFVMIAHAAFDLTAYAIIYWDLETTVAHWVFH